MRADFPPSERKENNQQDADPVVTQVTCPLVFISSVDVAQAQQTTLILFDACAHLYQHSRCCAAAARSVKPDAPDTVVVSRRIVVECPATIAH